MPRAANALLAPDVAAQTVAGTGPLAARWRLVALVLAGGLSTGCTRHEAGKHRRPAITSLAVLPLANLSGDSAQDYFADGMTEALIGNLARIRALRVVSRTSVMRFRARRAPLSRSARP